jgi:hypothetical protein
MEIARRLLERAAPRSTFSLVLLTLSVICLIVGFFAQDLRPVSVLEEMEDESDFVASSTSVPQRSVEQPKRNNGGFRLPKTSQEEFDLATNIGGANHHARRLGDYDFDDETASVQPSQRVGRLALTANLAPGCVALLSRTCDCRWGENAKNLREGTQIKVGQTLNIAAGLVEIAFGCGATAVVEGPAVLELDSNKSGSLHTGKMTANVPDDVEGFTVRTPTAQVVSLCKTDTKAVAKLSSIADCLWADGSAVTKEGAKLVPGQAVKLASGLAEITFVSGAKVILQGPANLEIESTKTATLHNGRLTADVPDNLEGFKIHTATAEILSLPAETKNATAATKVAVKRN